MATRNNQEVTIGGAIVFKEYRGGKRFLLVKIKEDGDWEFPKATVRRGESSVRSVIRLTGEQGGITARVLEEAGRYKGSTVVNGKTVSQKYYYYLMIFKEGTSEMIGFYDSKWIRSQDLLRKLKSKKEKEMFKGARQVLKEWEKTQKEK